MEEDNDGALKRQLNKDQNQDSQDDPLTTSPKRSKLNTDTTEGTVLPQEPLDSNSNGTTNEALPLAQNGELTLAIVNGQASIISTSQQGHVNGTQHTMPATSSSPFALHPILDELTNKPIYPSHESPPGMRMSMSAILTETGKGYHDRPASQNNNNSTDPMTAIVSSSSLSLSSNVLPPTSSQPSSSSRGQSLPPVNHFPHHLHHPPSTGSETYQRQTVSPLTESSSSSLQQQQQQQQHHRTSSHPTIASMMTQRPSDTLPPPPPPPVKEDNKVSSPSHQQHRQSITNEQLVRALTTSIPMTNDHPTPPQLADTLGHPSELQQQQPTRAKSDAPTSSPFSPPPPLPSTAPAPAPVAAPVTQPEVKQEEPATAITAFPSTTTNASSSPSQPDFSAALRRLSEATGLDQQQHPSGKKEDVSPSEILGSALAAVARSQQHGTSTTAAAVAIGNLAAITANISHILNNNNNNNNTNDSNASPLQQPSQLAGTMSSSSSSSSSSIAPGMINATASPPPPPAIIPSPVEQQSKDGTKSGNSSSSTNGLEEEHRRDASNSNTRQPLHPSTLSTMLDQAIQLGRTQQYQLQQDESSAGTRAHHTVNQETAEGMKRAAEAAAEVAAAVVAAASVPTTTTTNTTTNSPSTSPSSSSPPPIRLQQQQQQQPSPSHYNHTGTSLSSSSSLPPPPNQPQSQQPLSHHPHHHHHHHPYHHPYQAPLPYGHQMMYSTPPPPPSTAAATAATTTSLHASSPPIYHPPHPHPPLPPSVLQQPKVVINNEKVWKAMENKKETNLGFYLYQPSMLLPNLQDNLNGIVQVRIPSRYLSYQNPKVKKRAIWGTGIYTDDSDVVSMAIHSGKFIPAHHDPELESNDPFLLAITGKTMDSVRAATKKQAMSPKTYLKGRYPDDTLPDYDLNVTLRVLPKLQDYTSTIQHRIKSRKWGGNHDGVSFFVEKVEQLKIGEARSCGRSSLKSNLFRYESYRKQAPQLTMAGAENGGSSNHVI